MISQSIDIAPNLFYFVSYVVSGRTAGSVTPIIGGTTGTAVSTNDTHTETIEAGSTDTLIQFDASFDFDGDIDNVSVKQTSVDFLEASLDSGDYIGGAYELAGFNTDFEFGFFNGPSLNATIDTIELNIIEGRRARVIKARPRIHGGDVSMQIGTRNILDDPVSFTGIINERSSGVFTKRNNARYHRFRCNITGDFEDAIGVEVEKVASSGNR